MLAADNLIEQSINRASARPTQLFLTGDQIYADDVATALLAPLIELAKDIAGEEKIPDPRNNTHPPIEPATLQLASRHKIMDKTIGFTSSERKNHLMTLGEYMAMYFVCWGGTQVNLPHYRPIRRRLIEDQRKATSADYFLGGHKVGAYQSKSSYRTERTRTSKHLRNSWRCRRLMANISSYMIFDDHDVTDDWNLEPKTSHLLKTNPLSKRVIGNALAAYWACQDWGNDPENLDHTHIKSLLQEAHNHGDKTQLALADEALINRRWGFDIKQTPYVIALDTRTHRVFDHNGRPGLLDKAGMDNFEKKLNDTDNNIANNTVLIVSPAPVYGFKAVELLQSQTPPSMAHIVDMESWIANKAQYEAFKKIIARCQARDVVVFSGDVHYGFARREQLNTTTVWQLTSSALSNRPTGGNFAMNTLENLTIFFREKTPYLIPNNMKNDFICADATIGFLSLDKGKPVTFTAHCRNDRKQAYQWCYDLKHPKLLND